MKIALVEDNEDLRDLLMRDLLRAGYEAQGASCAEELDRLSLDHLFDLLLLDLNLPGENGLDIARRYKKANPSCYIIMLTARIETEDKILGYGVGADVYLTKPISSDELLAAIGSMRNRMQVNQPTWEAVLNLRDLTLSSNGSIALNQHEAIILKTLIESSHQKLPYFQLLENCDEPITDNAKATLEVRIVRLRKKMASVGLDAKSIRALRGEGYHLLSRIRIEF